MTEDNTSNRNALTSAVKLFRLGMEGQASKMLVEFIDSFLPSLAGATPEHIGRISPLLNEIMAAQARKDYLRVADLLEYEITPLL